MKTWESISIEEREALLNSALSDAIRETGGDDSVQALNTPAWVLRENARLAALESDAQRTTATPGPRRG